MSQSQYNIIPISMDVFGSHVEEKEQEEEEEEQGEIHLDFDYFHVTITKTMCFLL
jgi:hypothetical protein